MIDNMKLPTPLTPLHLYYNTACIITYVFNVVYLSKAQKV